MYTLLYEKVVSLYLLCLTINQTTTLLVSFITSDCNFGIEKYVFENAFYDADNWMLYADKHKTIVSL